MESKREYFTTEHFECQCSSDEHTLKFTLDETSGDFEDLEIWTAVFLNQYRPWWKRVWVGLKYIFGYNSRYGHWDCFIMRGKDVNRLMTMLQKYKEIEAKLEAKEAAKQALERVCNGGGDENDIGKLQQEQGPFLNAPENFDSGEK